MSFTTGNRIKVTLFGQSHSDYIGVVIDGLPCGFKPDFDKLNNFLSRRKPGQSDISTKRKESDIPEIISGLNKDGRTCGAPLTVIIRNENRISSDYERLRYTPRPGHCDYTAFIKYGEDYDYRGGGQFSGRMTAPLCAAGGILKQILELKNIHICSKIKSIGNISDDETDFLKLSYTDFLKIEQNPLPVFNKQKADEMKNLILSAKENNDSVGGIISCVIYGLPEGIGEPFFDSMESRISSAVFSIPGVKGIEFGEGFGCTYLYGSENNDEYFAENGRIFTKTNHCGGITGGISNGMPVTFNVAFKPVSSISKEQNTVNLKTVQNEKLTVTGRHDPCIIPRAAAAVEALTAIVTADLTEV